MAVGFSIRAPGAGHGRTPRFGDEGPSKTRGLETLPFEIGYEFLERFVNAHDLCYAA